MTSVYPLKCRIRAEGKITRVDVFDDIGDGGWLCEGVTAKDFAAQLGSVKGALEVHINSAGGDVFDGIAISSAIRAHKGRATTVVDGLAASIASVIAQAGQERVIQPGGMLMVHDAFGLCVGDAAEMTAMAGTLDKVSDNIAAIYAGRAGGSQESWRDTMRDETWYTAEEAVAAGLADRIGEADAELPPDLDLAALGTVPGRIAARLRTMPAAAAQPHGPMSGSHSHSHPAYGSQGTDSTHDHTHSHDGDASHNHSHADSAQDRLRNADGGDGDGEDDGKTCPTCKGKGTILDGHRKCPDCNGTGKVPDDDSGDGDGAQDGARVRVVAVATRTRVLGIESMPLLNEAIPVHHTATVDTPWDGPAAVAGMPNDAKVLRYCHAWEDTGADDGTADDPDGDADDTKAAYKFPHHVKEGGPANLAACRNGLARLSSANIPSGDDAGVEAHLNAHLKDGGGHPGSDNHAGLSGMSPEQIRAALKGATE